MGQKTGLLTASQRRRIEAAEMKLLRPLAGYTLYDHKTNNSIRKQLRITSILDKIDEYRKKWLLHIQRMPQNRIPLKFYNYRPQGRNQWDDLKNVGQSNYNPGEGTDQRVQSLVFMMTMTNFPFFVFEAHQLIVGRKM